MHANYDRTRNLVGALCLTLGIVGTFWFALGGVPSSREGLISALGCGAVLGLLQGRRGGVRLGLAIGLVTALVVGLALGLLLVVFPERVGAARALSDPGTLAVVVLAMNLAMSLVRLRVGQPWSLRWEEWLSMGGANGALVNGLAMFHAVLGGATLTLAFVLRGLLWALSGAVIGVVTAPVAEYLALGLKPRLRVFIALVPYLREVWVPLSGFAFGYVSLIFLFASVIGATWRADTGAYQGFAAAPHFGAFFYLSVQTITGLGFTNVSPNSGYAKSLASIEVIVGVLWNTVFLATFIAYLQPRFARITAPHDRTSSASKPDSKS